MKQPILYRVISIVSLMLMALALPASAQDKKATTEKKPEQKTKQVAPAKKEALTGTQAAGQSNGLPSQGLNKGVKEPSIQSAGNNQLSNVLNNKESFDKAVKLEIHEVLKEDAKARPSTNAKERLVPVLIKWKGQSINNGKLVELEAILETENTDNSKSKVAKKIIDLRIDKLIDEQLLLPMKEGTFARSFKLTLSGKCASGEGAKRQVASISAVKQGNFPLPN